MSTTSPTDRDDVTRSPVGAPAELIGRVSEAWARQDADAFADLFTSDGTMALPGHFLGSQEEIRQFLAVAYSGPFRGTRVVGTPVRVRKLAEGCVLVQTVGGVVRADEDELAPEREVNASWLAVLGEGGWRLAAYHNSPRHAA